jgi:hypothetical protein
MTNKPDRMYYYSASGKVYSNIDGMIAYLLDQGVLVSFNTTGEEGDILTLHVLINDMFIPAADSLSIVTDETVKLFELYNLRKHDGIVEFSCLKLNSQPRKKFKESMIKNNTWTDELGKLPECKYIH